MDHEDRRKWISRVPGLIGQLVRELGGDARGGLRSLARSPGTSLAAILTLAFGIGAGTAVFSMLHAILLQPLPIDRPDEVVVVSETYQGEDFDSVSLPNFQDWKTKASGFRSLAAYRSGKETLQIGGYARRLSVHRVSAEYFQVLGVSPLLGRFIEPAEEQEGVSRVVLLGHDYWIAEYGGDLQVVGRLVQINQDSYRILGVLPALRVPGMSGDLTFPLPVDSSLNGRGRRTVQVVGRLQPEVEVSQARDSMNVLAEHLAEQYPESNRGWGVRVVSLRDSLVAEAGETLYVMLLAVVMLLLIGCGNVAGINFIRAHARDRELAIRSALGASRARLFRQLLAGDLVTGLLGGALGVLLAFLAVSSLARVMEAFLPRAEEIQINSAVLLFSLLLSIFSGVLSGLLPAVRSLQTPLAEMLAGAGRRLSPNRYSKRVQDVLVMGEIALALVLLSCASIFLRSLYALQEVDLGLETEGIITFRLSFPEQDYPTAPRIHSTLEEIKARLETLPGGGPSEFTTHLPLAGQNMTTSFEIAGRPDLSADNRLNAGFRIASPGYFQLVGVPLKSGRSFAPNDRAGAPPVCLINESTTRLYFQGQNPIGRLISFERGDNNQPIWSEVIGVVADVRHFGPARDPIPEIYQSSLQAREGWAWVGRSVSLLSRTQSPPSEAQVQSLVKSIDPGLVAFNYAGLTEILRGVTLEPRVRTFVLTGCGLLALFLAASGIHVLMSFRVRSQRRELAVRLAVGARDVDLIQLVLGRSLRLVAGGVTVGITGSLFLGGLISRFLFMGPIADRVSLLTSLSLLVLASLLVSLLPAIQAVRTAKSALLTSSN